MFEDNFEAVVSSTSMAMDAGIISYGSFISKRSILDN
jgi:hypothetical protein